MNNKNNYEESSLNEIGYVVLHALIDKAADALEAIDWQDISSAPKNGSVFDVWISSHEGYTDAPKRLTNCRINEGVMEYRHSHGWFPVNLENITISHWIPLPTPPETV